MKRICLVLSLIIIIFSTGCNDKASPDKMLASQKEAFSFLPYNTKYLLYLNNNNLKKSGIWKGNLSRVLPDHKTDEWLNKLQRQTGKKLSESIEEIYSASFDEEKLLMLYRLGTNQAEIKNFFKESGEFVIYNVKGKEIFKLKSKKPLFFSFNSANFISSSSDSSAFIKYLNSGQSLSDNTNLVSLINKIHKKKYYWLISNDSGFLLSLLYGVSKKQDVNISDLLSSVTYASMCSDFDDNTNIEAVLGCKSGKDAFLISNGIKSAIAMGLLSNNNKVTEEILTKAEIERVNNTVKVTVKLTQQDIENLKQLNKKIK